MIRVTLGLLCWPSVFSFLLRGSGGKRRHKDPSFQVPLAPGLSRKWDLERSKLVTKPQPLCELFVDHDSRVVTLLESIFLSDLKSSLLCCTMWKWKYQLSFLALPSI